jgi:hypothetical protein
MKFGTFLPQSPSACSSQEIYARGLAVDCSGVSS